MYALTEHAFNGSTSIGEVMFLFNTIINASMKK